MSSKGQKQTVMNAKRNPYTALCVKAWISPRQPECQEAVKAVRTICRASERLLKTSRWADFLFIYYQFKAGDESKVAAVASAARRVCVFYSRLLWSPEVTLVSTQTPSDMLTARGPRIAHTCASLLHSHILHSFTNT